MGLRLRVSAFNRFAFSDVHAFYFLTAFPIADAPQLESQWLHDNRPFRS